MRTTAYNLNVAPQWQQSGAQALVERVHGHPELMRLAIHRSLRIPWTALQHELNMLSGRLDEALQELIGKQVLDAGNLAQRALSCLTIFPQPRMIVEVATAASGDAADGLGELVAAGVIAIEQDELQRYALHSAVLDWSRGHSRIPNAELQAAQMRTIKSGSCRLQGETLLNGSDLVKPV